MIWSTGKYFRSVCVAALISGISLNTNKMAEAQVAGNEISTDSNLMTVKVPIQNDKIVWADVAAEIADNVKLDRASIAKMFPKGTLDLNSPATVLALIGIDLALGDAVSIHVIKDGLGESSLKITCDRHALGWTKPNKPSPQSEIFFDDDWKTKTKSLPLIICLHGIKSNAGRFNEFRGFLRQQGYATAAVSYDDNQAIADSARQLSKLARQQTADADHLVKMILVGHSMGGLVAREWTENETLGDNVAGLITVGSPHKGSNWAAMPPLLDFFVKEDFEASDIVDVLLHQPSAPGLRDLIPDSIFLIQLNSRERRTDLNYLAIAGEASPLNENEVAQLRDFLRSLERKNGFVRTIRPRIAPLLNSFEELVRGKGDGVVSVRSATLPRIDPPKVVFRSHVNFFIPAQTPADQPVWKTISTQLREWHID